MNQSEANAAIAEKIQDAIDALNQAKIIAKDHDLNFYFRLPGGGEIEYVGGQGWDPSDFC